MSWRSFFALAADIACAIIGMKMVRHADTLPPWADLTVSCVGVVFIWLCLVAWPWERKPE